MTSKKRGRPSVRLKKNADQLPWGFIAGAKYPARLKEALDSYPSMQPSEMASWEVRAGKSSLTWAEVRDAMAKQLSWRQKSRPSLRQRTAARKRIRDQYVSSQKVFQLFRKVLEARNVQGLTNKEISEKYGISPSTVSYWASGKYFPTPISPRVLTKGRGPEFEGTKAQRKRPADFAYVLGTVLNSRAIQRASSIGSLQFMQKSSSRELRDELARRLEAVTGQKPISEDTPAGFKVNYNNTPFAQFFSRVTHYGTRVPEELLSTKAERQAFLRAAFDMKGGLSSAERTIVFQDASRNEPVYSFVKQCLNGLGISFKEAHWKTHLALFISPRDLPRFKEQVGFRNPKNQKKLDALIKIPGHA